MILTNCKPDLLSKNNFIFLRKKNLFLCHVSHTQALFHSVLYKSSFSLSSLTLQALLVPLWIYTLSSPPILPLLAQNCPFLYKISTWKLTCMAPSPSPLPSVMLNTHSPDALPLPGPGLWEGSGSHTELGSMTGNVTFGFWLQIPYPAWTKTVFLYFRSENLADKIKRLR